MINKTFKLIAFLLALTSPVFLFGTQAYASDLAGPGIPIKIVFALDQSSDLMNIENSYQLSNVAQIFDNPSQGNVYTAMADSSELPKLKSDKRVDYAQVDFVVAAADLTVSQVLDTNDPYFTQDPTSEDSQWYLPKTHIPEAWSYSRGSSSIVVAVVDTGIHASHLDLNDGRVGAGFDVVDQTPILANTDSDDNGHGTAIAGVIGAIPNNAKGVAGINWNITMMPIKALNASGTGNISDIAQGIVWAADHGANIINMSLGGQGFNEDPVLANAVSYAFKKNILIVAAAGNDLANQGLNLDTNPVYPVCADNGQNMILGVAASDLNDKKADFSNFGINCVDIIAPGKRILTTTFLPSDPSDSLLIYGSGTSLAAPIVTGVAALIKSAHPEFTNVQIRDLIMQTADNVDSINTNNCLGSSCNGFLGSGRLNALSALTPRSLPEGSLVIEQGTNKIFYITGKTKRYVSPFVFTQRGFSYAQLINDDDNQLGNYDTGPVLPPLDGTLIKSQSDATVYFVSNGNKLPLTYLVFLSRNFSFANVKTLPDADAATIPTGNWYWPPDGTLVLIKGDPTVYVMDKQVARPVTYFVFTQRKLSFSKVITVTSDEFSHVPRPQDSYWLAPLDGTLLKSSANATVYVIENGVKRPLSANAFAVRKYSFKNIKTLPQAEVDVIQPGDPIF